MRGVLLLAPAVALALAATLPAAAAELASPIAPAASGELQCTGPDTVKKTCQSITAYKVNTKGPVESTATVLVSQSPVVVMTTVTKVVIRGNQVCTQMRPTDIGNATYSVDGKPASEGQANTFRSVMQAAMLTSFGKAVCTAYVAGPDGLSTQVTIEGMPQPGSQRVIWVSPADGYKVAP
jgi:hypothetical protein